ncbi:solute carrier family 23 member 1-like isoform X2 [Bolinopsis microptera]|uniref:solute carrier family 23 member 1-like isoform X2 n=1 Tax=Bolinopsis microptera TaxID=2820187 RepID=UPI003078CDCD
MVSDSSEDSIGKNHEYKPVHETHMGVNGDAGSGEVNPADEYIAIRKQLKFPVDKSPGVAMAFLLGFQQYLIMFGPTFAIPVILSPSLCIATNVEAKGQLLNTMFVMCGLATLLQIFFGTRLPIIQSGSYVFFAVAAGIMSKSPCQKEYFVQDENGNNVTQDWDPNWHKRMAELQGNLMAASVLQMILGGFGLVGFLLKIIGPITITVLISLIGLCLAGVAAGSASQNWGIALLMVALVTLFSEYLKNVPVPLPYVTYSRGSGAKFQVAWLKLFSTLSIILSLIIVWALCGILTATDTFAEGNPARVTDLKKRIDEASWFYFPYPGQFGTPIVTVGGFVGMVAGVIGGVIESIGDYYACAKLAGAPPPPKYVLNRGILLEGVGCFLTGLCGPGVGVTSYSENIGAIALTKVGSRTVILCSAILMLIIGLIGKVGIFFASMPEPIIGGMYLVMFGIIAAVGISNLQFVDLTSSRNVFIIGVSLYIGLVVPMWAEKVMADDELKGAIQTGNEEFDQLVAVILTSGMIIGAVIACFLDNTIPGTDKERGMESYKLATKACSDKALLEKIYYEPLMEKAAKRFPGLRRLPFVNGFKGFSM